MSYEHQLILSMLFNAVLFTFGTYKHFKLKETKENQLKELDSLRKFLRRVQKELEQDQRSLLKVTRKHQDSLKELEQEQKSLLEVTQELEDYKKKSILDDATAQTVSELTTDLKTHGFNLIRINPDHVFLRQ